MRTLLAELEARGAHGINILEYFTLGSTARSTIAAASRSRRVRTRSFTTTNTRAACPIPRER